MNMRVFDIIGRMEKEFEDLKRAIGLSMLKRRPACDVLERNNELILRIDLPGFSKKDIDIELGENYINSKAERKEEEKGRYLLKERVKSIYRRMDFPYEIDSEKAKAKLRNGVLEIIIPKKKGRKGRKIEIE